MCQPNSLGSDNCLGYGDPNLFLAKSCSPDDGEYYLRLLGNLEVKIWHGAIPLIGKGLSRKQAKKSQVGSDELPATNLVFPKSMWALCRDV